jgi:hypothetical protein
MVLSKRKRKAPDIVSGIPFDERESVNLVTIDKKNKQNKQKRRIVATSTEISVPITSSFLAEGPTESLPLPRAAECDVGVYSDTEEATTQTTQKPDRKGPSRSVSVSPFLLYCVRVPAHSFQLQTKMEEFVDLRDGVSDDMMKHESPSGYSDRCCATCPAANATFRCLDCLAPFMMCQPCLIAAHQSEVLHTIQVSPPHKRYRSCS